MSENVKPIDPVTMPPEAATRPNEQGTVSVQGFVKIWDPATAKVFVEKRA